MSKPVSPQRRLPSVDGVLRSSSCAAALTRYDRAYVVQAVRGAIAALRGELDTEGGSEAVSAEAVMELVMRRIAGERRTRVRRVINATGVVLHTNIGRAVLPAAAVDAATLAATGAVDLEFDIDSGRRGDRGSWINEDLLQLTGAEAGTVVNNNAAAVLLALNSLAEGQEVIVSRGELIEIGGSFRIPDVMAKSGAVLREVGTTNRTHARDYEAAINERTALLLKVHTSNYRIVGFASEVSLPELVRIGREHSIPVMEDLGSGALVDLSAYGLPKEPIVRQRIEAGADLVTFSGDKLLGGPQAGLLVGRSGLVERIDGNPLKRALRCDKLTLAALAETLRFYRTSPDLRTEIPTLRWLTRPLAEMEEVGRSAVERLRDSLGPGFAIELVDDASEIGSGALPVETLPTKAIAITHDEQGPDAIARRFRAAEPAILGRIRRDQFVLDLRCISDPSDLVPGAPGKWC